MTVQAKVRNTFTPSIHLLTALWDVPSKRFGITELLAWKFQKKNAVGDFGPSPESPMKRQVKMIQHKQMAGIHTRRHRNILGAHNYNNKCIHTHTYTHTHTQKRKEKLHTQMHAHQTHMHAHHWHTLTHAHAHPIAHTDNYWICEKHRLNCNSVKTDLKELPCASVSLECSLHWRKFHPGLKQAHKNFLFFF